MVFSDLFFLFVFIPAFALCYLLATFIDKKYLSNSVKQVNTCKNWTLVIYSLIFYAWGEPVYVFLMLFSVFVNFLVGRFIDSQQDEKKRKTALVIGLVANISIIAIFKYLGFLTQILIDLGIPLSRPNIALPIGISFYTFQAISYIMDVYRRVSPAQKRYRDLLLYISMFPQLIAGPIVRYETIASEINNRHVTAQDFADGSFRFLVGLGKKVIMANQLSIISTQFLSDGINDMSTSGASTSRDIVIWQSVWDDAWDSTSRKTSITPIAAKLSPIIGAVGTFRLVASSAIMSTSLWVVIAGTRLLTLVWFGRSPVCGMELAGTL